MTEAKKIKITNQKGENFSLFFKKISNLSDEELQNLIEKLSDENEFKNSNEEGVFYKNSTAKNPLTFKDMGLLEDIKNYQKTGKSSDESLLSSYALFSNDYKIIGYMVFYFYDGIIEPDGIIFKDLRGRRATFAIVACLLSEAFQEIKNRGKLHEYKKLYATVHPQNLASIRILEKLGFNFEEFSKDNNGNNFIKSPLIKDQNKLLLVEVQHNLNEANKSPKDSEKYRFRLIASNEENLPKLFKKLISILEQYTDYSSGIEFLRKKN
jgi:RimJ/RimL family protein N-acetyltransferase